MVCNGSVILALKGGARGLWNNIRTGQTCDAYLYSVFQPFAACI